MPGVDWARARILVAGGSRKPAFCSDRHWCECLVDALSKRSGIPRDGIIREQLERSRNSSADQSFMRLAGTVRGARNLSSALVKGIADTEFLVAFANVNDKHPFHQDRH